MTDNSRSQDALPGALDALEEAIYQFDRYAEGKTPLEAAERLVALSNAMSDLRTFHPGFDVETHTMPWDREDDE